MGKASIPYLFEDSISYKPTREWADLLRLNKQKYANCNVVSFTRVKDLNSDWKHEYLQFIVEDSVTKDRARVYAERGNETQLDWVTIGPADTKLSGNRDKSDMPLPLTSLRFGGKSDEVEKRPTVLDIAEILAATTLVGGAYGFYGHSCFWYAFTAYDAIKRQFGKWATEKKWRWGDIGGAGNAGIKDAIGLGWSTLFKFYYVGHAKKFKEERETGLNWYGDRRPIVDNLDVVDQVKSFFESSENQQSFIQTMKDENFDFSELDINDRVRSSRALAEKSIDDEKNWTQEFNKLQSTLVERTSEDTEGQKYADLYKTFEVPVEMNEVMAEGAGDFETKKALEIVVGRILTEAQKN